MRTLLVALAILMSSALAHAQESVRFGEPEEEASDEPAPDAGADADEDNPVEEGAQAPVYQDVAEYATPSDSQKLLLEQADAAFAAQNPALARALLQQVVDESPLRSVYLRLAAASAGASLCLEAQDYLDSADVAPIDKDEAELAGTRAQVQSSLEGRCGQFSPVCLPGDIVLEVAEGQHRPCSEKPFWLPPGKRLVFFDFEAAAPTRATVTILQGQVASPTLIAASERRAAVSEASIYLSDAMPLEIAKTPPPVDPTLDLEGPGTLRIAGWSLLGAGAVATVAGAVFAIQLSGANDDAASLAKEDRLDLGRVDRVRDDAQFFENAEITSYSLAGAFLIAGGILLWMGEDDPETATLTPVLGPDSAGAVWTVRWQ
jgi:hypothetical protein